jgi:hypothetical protein
MGDEAEIRDELIRFLANALAIADELKDGETAYLIEKALDLVGRGKGQGPKAHRLSKLLASPWV